MSAAIKAAKVRRGQRSARDAEGLRRALAGDLREDGEWRAARGHAANDSGGAGGAPSAVGRAVAAGIRAAQAAAAWLREGWYQCAKKEISRRADEEAVCAWRGPVMGAWREAAAHANDDDEDGATATSGEAAGVEVGTAVRTEGMSQEQRSGEGDSGRRQGSGLQAESEKRRGTRQRGANGSGWTMARALIEYKKWQIAANSAHTSGRQCRQRGK